MTFPAGESTLPLPVSRSISRWGQLVAAVLCMMAISSPQYVWTMFTGPLGEKFGATLPSIQITFSLLIIVQTLFSPVQGWLLERFGIRMLISIGCLLSGASWLLASMTSSLIGLYITYGIIGGVGTGIVYLGCVSLMVRCFPDHRGFAVGAVAAGYGMGAMITTVPISLYLSSSGIESTLRWFGILLGVVGVIISQFLRAPNESQYIKTQHKLSVSPEKQFTPKEMLSTPLFWLMFIMFVMMSTSGLMVTSQLATFAKDFGVAGVTIMGVAAVPLALTLDRICNGATRPLFGWVSDHIGRENTMALAFGLEGIAMIIWLMTMHHPIMFVLLSGIVFLGWGEIFSLFPATLTDTFGTQHAATNYGFLYIAQGVGSILGGPLAAMLYAASHSWYPVFTITISCDFITALLALFVLKKMRKNLRNYTKT